MDSFTLSRPKKNIARDFADGCLVAEIVQKYQPHLVQLHNYSAVNNKATKLANWRLLEQKVLRKLELRLPPTLVAEIIESRFMAVEKFLLVLKTVLETTEVARPRVRPPGTALAEPSRPETGVDSRKFRQAAGPGEGARDEMVAELREAVELLEHKLGKLHQMLKVKDDKIRLLEQKIFELGGG